MGRSSAACHLLWAWRVPYPLLERLGLWGLGMPTCPSWALSVSQGTLPGTAMNGKRAGGSQGQEETQELQGPSWEEGQSISHQAAPRQGWLKGTWRMLLESGGELLREAPKTCGKGCARGPRVPARSQQQPRAWGPAHALQEYVPSWE